jgi:hypothetical protein
MLKPYISTYSPKTIYLCNLNKFSGGMAVFKCNLCGFETDDAVVFASHILSQHTNVGETKAVEIPTNKAVGQLFECELCDAKFLTPEELEKHYYEAHPKEMKEIEEELKKEFEKLEESKKDKRKKKSKGEKDVGRADIKSGEAEGKGEEAE